MDDIHAAIAAVSARCNTTNALQRIAKGTYMLGDKRLYIRVMRKSIIVRVGKPRSVMVCRTLRLILFCMIAACFNLRM